MKKVIVMLSLLLAGCQLIAAVSLQSSILKVEWIGDSQASGEVYTHQNQGAHHKFAQLVGSGYRLVGTRLLGGDSVAAISGAIPQWFYYPTLKDQHQVDLTKDFAKHKPDLALVTLGTNCLWHTNIAYKIKSRQYYMDMITTADKVYHTKWYIANLPPVPAQVSGLDNKAVGIWNTWLADTCVVVLRSKGIDVTLIDFNSIINPVTDCVGPTNPHYNSHADTSIIAQAWYNAVKGL